MKTLIVLDSPNIMLKMTFRKWKLTKAEITLSVTYNFELDQNWLCISDLFLV